MTLATAQQLDAWGFNVLPAPVRDKAPTVAWKKWTSIRTTHMLTSWFTGKASNYWVATGGISGCYVLDIDNEAADRYWREVVGFGPEMDRTVCARTAKGHHYYFWVAPTDSARGWSRHDKQVDFDIRGVGGGVIAPPSVHESGFVYEWVRPPVQGEPTMGMVPAPDWMKSAEATARRIGGKPEGADPAPVAPVRSVLSQLLSKPPSEGGRNDWLTKVAGHYAKHYRKTPDLFWLHLGWANEKLTPPLDRAEFEKVGNSIWEGEFERHPERALSEQTGWLVSGGDRILTQAQIGKGEDAVLSLDEWADFDLQVEGVIRAADDPGNLIYECRMLRKDSDGGAIEVLLPAKTLGDPRALSKFLAGYGATISRPDKTIPRNPPDPVRLQRYLEAQQAPSATMVGQLGWHEPSGAFLTFDGILRVDGAHPFSGVRPDPRLRERGQARFNYGMGDLDRAREVLRQVLTFHDEQTAAVFGAWWAATLVKPQLQAHTSLFPIMAIEAASGAGKTNGYFALMLQLAGGLAGATQGTIASSRDRIAAHRSGIVWIDDLDSLERLHELLRATTSNETITKKGIDNTANVNIALVAPVVVSGEALGLGSQKALIDRVVALQPPKPDSRTSLIPGREGRPQWDDIVELTSQYPLRPGATGAESDGLGLSIFAGALQVEALRLADQAREELVRQRAAIKKVAGRQAEKLAILLAGSWLLDRLCGYDTASAWAETIVNEWCLKAEAVNGSAGDWDNRLTIEILPWYLNQAGWPDCARGKPAAYVERGEQDLLGPVIWVNCLVLAQAWRDAQRGRIVERTDTQRAIREQLARCDATSALQECGIGRSDRNQALYWKVEGEVARVVLERSQG